MLRVGGPSIAVELLQESFQSPEGEELNRTILFLSVGFCFLLGLILLSNCGGGSPPLRVSLSGASPSMNEPENTTSQPGTDQGATGQTPVGEMSPAGTVSGDGPVVEAQVSPSTPVAAGSPVVVTWRALDVAICHMERIDANGTFLRRVINPGPDGQMEEVLTRNPRANFDLKFSCWDELGRVGVAVASLRIIP